MSINHYININNDSTKYDNNDDALWLLTMLLLIPLLFNIVVSIVYLIYFHKHRSKLKHHDNISNNNASNNSNNSSNRSTSNDGDDDVMALMRYKCLWKVLIPSFLSITCYVLLLVLLFPSSTSSLSRDSNTNDNGKDSMMLIMVAIIMEGCMQLISVYSLYNYYNWMLLACDYHNNPFAILTYLLTITSDTNANRNSNVISRTWFKIMQVLVTILVAMVASLLLAYFANATLGFNVFHLATVYGYLLLLTLASLIFARRMVIRLEKALEPRLPIAYFRIRSYTQGFLTIGVFAQKVIVIVANQCIDKWFVGLANQISALFPTIPKLIRPSALQTGLVIVEMAGIAIIQAVIYWPSSEIFNVIGDEEESIEFCNSSSRSFQDNESNRSDVNVPYSKARTKRGSRGQSDSRRYQAPNMSANDNKLKENGGFYLAVTPVDEDVESIVASVDNNSLTLTSSAVLYRDGDIKATRTISRSGRGLRSAMLSWKRGTSTRFSSSDADTELIQPLIAETINDAIIPSDTLDGGERGESQETVISNPYNEINYSPAAPSRASRDSLPSQAIASSPSSRSSEELSPKYKTATSNNKTTLASQATEPTVNSPTDRTLRSTATAWGPLRSTNKIVIPTHGIQVILPEGLQAHAQLRDRPSPNHYTLSK